MPNGPVELTLDPEELGRVRMTLSGTDMSMTVTLVTERAETSDLMRRHIEVLAQEFRQLGYRDVSFNFAGRDPDGQAEGGRTAHPSGKADEPPETPAETAVAPYLRPGSDRMDIRL